MRWTWLVLLPALLGAAEIGGSNVRTVYILPMSHGLDQYLANQLTREHVLDVVADPARADALFTDRLGKPLEAELEKLHPTPKPPEPKEPAVSEKDKDKDKDKGKDSAGKDKSSAGNTNRDAEPPPVSTFGGGKGTLFLVDAHSRSILWSTYQKPTVSNSAHLDRTAKRVVARLKLDLAGK